MILAIVAFVIVDSCIGTDCKGDGGMIGLEARILVAYSPHDQCKNLTSIASLAVSRFSVSI